VDMEAEMLDIFYVIETIAVFTYQNY